MKQLDITTEQKDKLIEMCEVLFPNNFDADDCSIDDDGVIDLWDDISNSPMTEANIHWFEFCMTHLSHAIIFNPDNKLSACNHNHARLLESTMSVFYGEAYGIHPIDYLYKEFKKL